MARETNGASTFLFEHVLEAERALIGEVRGTSIDPLPEQSEASGLVGGCNDSIGLALSGGGIRSAAFCTGVMQGLQRHGVISKLDYLSTVSGGGYAGAAVSLGLAKTGKFPFLSDDKDEKVDSPAMRELRNNANYLKFGRPGQMLVNLAVYLRGLIANTLYLFPVLLIFAAFTLFWNPTYAALGQSEIPWLKIDHGLGAFLFSLAALFLTYVFYCAWAVTRKHGELASRWNTVAIFSVLIVAIFTFFELQPVLVQKLIDAKLRGVDWPTSLVNTATVWVAPVGVVLSFLSKLIGDQLRVAEQGTGWRAFLRKYASAILMWVAGLIFPLLLWLVYLQLVRRGIDTSQVFLIGKDTDHEKIVFGPGTDIPSYGTAITYTVLAIAGLALSLFLSPNGNSLHRLYRDRLSSAFCFFVERDPATGQVRAQYEDQVALSSLKEKRPYHLINTSLNIQGSKKVNERGRNADFFLFSPGFTGSAATGYVHTQRLEAEIMNDSRFKTDLATAIAISGAAASANMGSQTIKPMAFTLALFNVRLGYWFPNPAKLSEKHQPQDSIITFVKEAFGFLDHEDQIVYLTDGGHVENLGIYELLRRRCKLIIAVDAEADGNMTFPSLITLQRYARIDLGVRIEMKWNKIQETSLEAQTGKAEAKRGPHCAIGRIHYDKGGTGILLYIKSSVTGDENDYVRDYNRRYRDFPHETTADQFFSEEQFECYRTLGFHAANNALSGEDAVQTIEGDVKLCTRGAAGFGVVELQKMLELKVEG
jgi:hypothetical protein